MAIKIKGITDVASVKIGGPAGAGVKSTGLMFAKTAARSGYQIYDNVEFPSLIRGGHNVMQINFSTEAVTSPRKNSDLLVAFDQETIDLHSTELLPGSGLIFDSDEKLNTSELKKDISLYGIPLYKLAKEASEKELFTNTVALGAVIGLFGGNLETLKQLIAEEFEDKGNEVIEENKKAAQLGYDYVLKNFKESIKEYLKPIDNFTSPIPYMVLTGNESVALGAIAAGMQFASIYPMSPISNILHVLATNQEKYGYIYKQPEDEISAINMAIGASFAGVRSMTATSGGGFCLMTEGYGLAGMTETPLVIVEGMRGAPATGLPTWSEQGDLQFVLHAHQGEFPRIVLAPGDIKEAFDITMQAFNLADKYQTPVVVLLDKNICENDQSFLFFDISNYKIDRGKLLKEKVDDYIRYKDEPDGVSQRAIPGSGNFFLANSDEHTQVGYSTEEIKDRKEMMQKRMQKLTMCEASDMQKPQIFGPEKADFTIVSWGSNKGSIIEALKSFRNVNFVHITWMNPFPADSLKKILSESKYILDVENNYTGQLANLIREKTGVEMTDKLLRYDGRIIYPEEIVERISYIEGVETI